MLKRASAPTMCRKCKTNAATAAVIPAATSQFRLKKPFHNLLPIRVLIWKAPSTEISDLGLWLVHRMLLVRWTQRIRHQSRPQRDRRGSDGSFLPSDEPRLLPRSRQGT